MPASPDLSILLKNQGIADYQRANAEFAQRKALQQAQIMQAQAQLRKSLMPEQITPYQAATLELQREALRQRGIPEPMTPFQKANLELQNRKLNLLEKGNQGAVGPLSVDENGELVVQPLRKLSATEQKDFSQRQAELADLEKSSQAFEAIKEYQGKPMFTGFGADTLATADTIPVLGKFIDTQKAANTKAYQNLVREGQFSKLQSTFPGAISNAEREALENLGALANFTPEQQAQILRNAQAAIERNKQITRQRAQDIVTGQQYVKAAQPVVLSVDKATMKESDIAQSLMNARKAIQKNPERRDAIIQRLIDNGIDPSKAGL